MSDEQERSKYGGAVNEDGYIVLGQDVQDNVIVPFQADLTGARGRLVRLGSAINDILAAHDYPDAVSNFLGEAIALAAMIGSSLKFDGKLILQTKTDGPISMLVVDFTAPGSLRAYASFDMAKVVELEGEPLEIETWLGEGFLALTVDQGPDMERYQGIVALSRGSLDEAAEAYFQQSEQIPSLVRLHVAKHYNSSDDDAGWQWRAGGLMVQYLTDVGGVASEAEGDVEEMRHGDVWDDEKWRRAKILGDSVEVHELLDPQLAPERLLFRLYHEEGVRVFEQRELRADCSCSRERVLAMLSNFSSAERLDMVEKSGKISVKCEFCTNHYEFDEADFAS